MIHYRLNDKGKTQVEEGVREYCHGCAVSCFDSADGAAKGIWFSDAETEADNATGEWAYISLEVGNGLSRDHTIHHITVDYGGFDLIEEND